MVPRPDCGFRVREPHGAWRGRIDDMPVCEDAPDDFDESMLELGAWSLEHLVDKGYVLCRRSRHEYTPIVSF